MRKNKRINRLNIYISNLVDGDRIYDKEEKKMGRTNKGKFIEVEDKKVVGKGKKETRNS